MRKQIIVFILGLFILLAFAVACIFLEGCSLVGSGAQVSVSVEADRKLAASIRSNVGVVLQGAKAAGGKETTVQLLDGAYAAAGTLQNGPIGIAEVPPWPQTVIEAVAAEQRCEEVVVQDPVALRALADEREARTKDRQDSERVHGELKILKDTAWSQQAVIEAGVASLGPLGAGLILLWRNRQKLASAAGKLSNVLQETKGDSSIKDVVDRHAPEGTPERAVIDKLYAQTKAGPKPTLRERAKKLMKKIKAPKLISRRKKS